MTKPIYVVGHKNPDTDSICAAIAYARLKQAAGEPVLPCRAGAVNRETRFVLDYFKVGEPDLLSDLHTRAKDLLHGDDLLVRPDMPLREAWMLMRSQGVKTLPVVDQGKHLLGLVTAGDLADRYLAELGEQDQGDFHVTVGNVVKTLEGKLINGTPETELHVKVVVADMETATMKQSLTPGCVVLVGDRENGQLAAMEAGAACLILTGGAELIPAVRAEVRARGTVVIGVAIDTFSAAMSLLTSIPVGSIMRTGDLVVFQEDDLLDEVKKVMLNTRFRSYPVVDEQNRVVGEISRYHLLGFSKHKVILVDHNEFSQAVEGAEKAQILEVVDHHRVGGIQTGEPILFRNEPVGATCTLVAKAFFEQGVTPDPVMAGLMCAGILSDTVVFKSPTCTQTDRDLAARLAKIAGIDALAFGIAMFKHASSVSGAAPRELLLGDYKEFAVGDLRMGIGQVSIMGPDDTADMKPGLLAEMEQVRNTEGIDYVLLMVTDLLSEATTLLIAGPDPEEIGAAFQAEVIANQVYLPGVLSRKKQVVPPLMKHYQQ